MTFFHTIQTSRYANMYSCIYIYLYKDNFTERKSGSIVHWMFFVIFNNLYLCTQHFWLRFGAKICSHSWYHYSIFCSLFRAMKPYPWLIFLHFLILVPNNILKYTLLSISPKHFFTFVSKFLSYHVFFQIFCQCFPLKD